MKPDEAKEQVEKVDHRDEARFCLEKAGSYLGAEDAMSLAAGQMANAHASLAIANQLERLNDKLDGSGLSAFLDQLQGGIQEIVWQNTRGAK